MASAGPNSPSAADGTVGTGTSWSNATNAYASDDARATATLSSGASTRFLSLTGFGFSIPSTATIDGIVLEIERSRLGQIIRDSSIKFLKAGSQVGDDVAATGTNWPTTDAYATYGTSTSLHGTTWSYSDINASNFGVEIKAVWAGAKGSGTARIDHVRITVYYTDAGGGGASIPVFMNHYRQQGICG